VHVSTEIRQNPRFVAGPILPRTGELGDEAGRHSERDCSLDPGVTFMTHSNGTLKTIGYLELIPPTQVCLPQVGDVTVSPRIARVAIACVSHANRHLQYHQRILHFDIAV
jgi:hypothetical protein